MVDTAFNKRQVSKKSIKLYTYCFYFKHCKLDDQKSSELPMQKALMFGASAIIILTLNQDILKESTIKLFADDISLYLIVDDPRESANNLNSDLANIHRWSSDWLVTFNPQKTETMTISRKLHKPDHPKLNMDNVTVTEIYPTLTLWSACGRTYGKGYHEWDGVVCLGHQENEEK
ncbi:hypothetical protein AM593_06915, partial [Mytilus galloprovincialis]